jgi:hypothetical protein
MDIKTIHSLPVTAANFNHLGYTVHSATRSDVLYCVWESAVLDGTDGLLSWTGFSYTATMNSNADRIYVYTKTSDQADMAGAEWSVPVVNGAGEIMSDKRYLSMRIVMRSPIANLYNYHGSTLGPILKDMTISMVVSDTASLLYTKTYELGFFPKAIVTTVQADVPDGAALDVGVTSLDSIDPDDYQFFAPNSVVELDQLAITGKKMKMMLRMAGSGSSTVVVHEFAAMFSGDGQARLNA